MSHLDEGTLHALLDGELELNEVREIQAHLGSCTACGTRLQSVKDVLAESDRLVASIQFPGTPRRPAALEPEPAPVVPGTVEPEFAPELDEESSEPPEAPRPPRGLQGRYETEPLYDEPPPLLLVPDESNWAERRRRVLTGMRWAAFVVMAVGAGYLANEVRRSGSAPATAPAAREALSDDPAAAVVSPEETSGGDSASAPARLPMGYASADRAAPQQAGKDAPTPASAAPPARAPLEPERRPLATPARNETTAEEPQAGGRADAPRDEVSADDAAADEEPLDAEEAPPPADVRTEAARALADLDRERRRERAAAATAALDSAARRRAAENARVAAAAAEPSPPPAPAPRTLEQRSRIYLRIGLDEAARQLGRPVHVVEGMQQQFMGLAQGAASPGGDPARPVVRVVYQDNQGRMILLDQQRVRPGQDWGSGELRWVLGEIGLALHGEPGPEVLRNLRPRVR